MKLTRKPRRRDATATRAAILDAARNLFAKDSYDNVGIREIASLAGVDSALVSRYFGCKQELFIEVLASGKSGVDVFGTDFAELPERVAEVLLDPDDEDNSLDDILLAMHSSSSPVAGPLVRASIDERFEGPFAAIIGGDNAMVRSQLFGAMLLGITISQQINGDLTENAALRDQLKKRISEIIALAISPL